jgi:predicted nucleic acid-binding protein
LTRTFLDAGVLIAAARGSGPVSERAVDILKDGNRAFVCSPFIRLEILPKALFYGQVAEVSFYRAYFDLVRIWVDPARDLVEEADYVAGRYGLAALDALHVTSAMRAEADELVTSERPSSPIHRVTGAGLSVRTIHLQSS